MSVNVSAIKNDEDLARATERLGEIFMVDADSPEAEEREVLGALIESYERIHYPIGRDLPAKPLPDYIKEHGLKPGDLVRVIGHKTRVSEILHGRRTLTLVMIRKLRKEFKIPYEVLLWDQESEPEDNNKTNQFMAGEASLR